LLILTVMAGLLAWAVTAFVWSARVDRTIAAEITDGIRNQIYLPIANAEGQARLLGSQADVREGIAERNRIRLRAAIRPALARMNVSYAGVFLPDGTPYYWFPDHERDVPIVAGRQPIEHELRTVGTLEYGAMLTEEFLGQLGSALSTDIRLAAPPQGGATGGNGASVLPTARADSQPELQTPSPLGTDVFSVVGGRGEPGYAYLRAPDNLAGPVIAVLEFGVPTASPGAARVRRERNVLWALIAGGVLLVAGYDLGQRRRQRAQAAAPFTPIANPYIVGNPIRTSDMFFGREDDFQFARQKLTVEQSGTVIVFCGDRRSGKTSMLFQILRGRLGPEFLPVLIDMQYFAAIANDRDFYESIVKEFVRAVYGEAEQDERRRRFSLPSEGAAQAFELVLNDAMAAFPDKTFLFLFDEYEILESKVERGELNRMVIPYLAGLLERHRRLSFIFTGSRNLEERPGQHWRLMLGKSQYRKISYLTRPDTERLVRQPVQGVVDYDAEAVSLICRLTSGQPFYTQVICQNLIDHLNEVRRRTVTRADVPAIVDGIVDNPLPQMIYFWDSLPADEKIALSLLAEVLGDDTSWAAAPRLLRDARDKGIPVATDVATLSSALEKLFERETLEKSANRAFQYRVDLLRHWIRRTHSIWQVVKEAPSVPHARS
jgi:hypothetical protein